MRAERVAAVACARRRGSVGAPAPAQDFPSRPITVVVPTGPGGGMEMVARLFGPKTGAAARQAVRDREPPRRGDQHRRSRGRARRARRPHAADGDVLDHGDQCQHLQEPAVRSAQGPDAGRALRAVPFVLVVNPSSPAQTAADLIKLAKEKPGTLELRHLRHRHGVAPVRRAVQDADRHRGHARALQEHGAAARTTCWAGI